MKRLWAFRVWHGLVSVPVAAGVGVITNLATEGFPWALTAGLVVLVLVQVGLSVWQAVGDQRDRRDARDELLGSLRPPVPPSPVPIESPAQDDSCSVLRVGAVVGWLTAPFTPTPLWGRKVVLDRLVAWCVTSGSGADVVRVVTGPAGVGKSRLALAVAQALPAGWMAGRLRDDAAGLVERIAAAGDRTLVIVDDAESAAASAMETLVTGAVRHPDLIRVLLLARTDAALRFLSDDVRPRLAGVEVLGPVGEAGDRQRWFIEAARAYARTWRVPAPDLPDRPVGRRRGHPAGVTRPRPAGGAGPQRHPHVVADRSDDRTGEPGTALLAVRSASVTGRMRYRGTGRGGGSVAAAARVQRGRNS
ncbi:hypothetical protein [Umezawaea sp. Da 62-37]|uniref:hypothetical protein n=1 Tax=Umezawaea sp. Da 62-37 TaxID=3075927 RepID=UPI0028F6F466|nr:hypothetical protein [Umezawaea sp. Da 62-37]WNV86706.1 hypothetical protein RM788_52785 [Umezawaea sp. Da 62-37]WNV86711.1 hypothetical protein RM788_00020 [Umezawaea sp. Da 62-37]